METKTWRKKCHFNQLIDNIKSRDISRSLDLDAIASKKNMGSKAQQDWKSRIRIKINGLIFAFCGTSLSFIISQQIHFQLDRADIMMVICKSKWVEWLLIPKADRLPDIYQEMQHIAHNWATPLDHLSGSAHTYVLWPCGQCKMIKLYIGPPVILVISQGPLPSPPCPWIMFMSLVGHLSSFSSGQAWESGGAHKGSKIGFTNLQNQECSPR